MKLISGHGTLSEQISYSKKTGKRITRLVAGVHITRAEFDSLPGKEQYFDAGEYNKEFWAKDINAYVRVFTNEPPVEKSE